MRQQKNLIMSVILTVVLLTVCIVEYVVGFKLLAKKINGDNDFYSAYASDYGKSHVTIEEIYLYDEAPVPVENGDVLSIPDFDIKIKVNGEITDRSYMSYGYATYANAEDKTPTRLSFNRVTNKLDEWNTAYNAYMNGHPEALLLCYGVRVEDSDNVYYQQSTQDGRSAVVYNQQNGTYYEFIQQDDAFVVVSSTQPFGLTKETATSQFGDPAKNPMYAHSYSNYEVLAAANTRREQLEKDEEDDDNPYTPGGVVGTAATYTSTADNNRRRQLASYANYKWDKSGASEQTTMIVDLVSSEARSSEWVLTATEYGYKTAGLSIYGMSGSRNATKMSISGTIANTVTAERPYVIVVKFLNEQKELLALQVIDNRGNPLGASGTSGAVQQFSASITSDDCDIQNITSIMFEAY